MSQGKIPFICGGTNYYIESLLWKVLVDKDIGKDKDSFKRKHGDDNPETLNKKIKNVDDKNDVMKMIKRMRILLSLRMVSGKSFVLKMMVQLSLRFFGNV